jgi:hypothetical protein
MRKLGIIVFGASVFDYHTDLNNSRFANSAREFRKTIVETKVLADFETETLDLYNKSLSASETLDKILDFSGKPFDDIIAFYCGHGDVGIRDGEYTVLLRKSNRERRHTLVNFPALIKSVKRVAHRKRVYFILDACYAGSAISETETMDAGGTETLIGRRLMETVQDNGSGTAVLAASGRFGAALARTEDRLTLFTGAFVRCLKEGITHKKSIQAFSWLDIKDEIIRVTQDRLGPDAPIPTLMSYSDSASDITRTPFFYNRAFVPNSDGGKDGPWTIPDDRVIEPLFWKHISEESPSFVLEDFLVKFPNGIFSKPARALLLKQIGNLDEKALDAYLLEHPRSAVLENIERRLAGLKWDRLKGSNDLAGLEQFVRRFPQHAFAGEARLQIQLSQPPSASEKTPIDQVPVNSASSNAFEAPSENANDAETIAPNSLLAGPAFGAATGPPPTSGERHWTTRFASRGGILITAAILALLAVIAGNYYIRTAVSPETSMLNLNAAGMDIAQLESFVERCQAEACPALEQAKRRLAKAQAAAEAAARERQFRNDLVVAGNDVTKLSKLVDDCKKASCAILNDATRYLAEVQAAEAAAREQQFRNDLVVASNDATKLRRLVDDCRKVSCAVLNDATRRVAEMQAAAEKAAREQQFRNDLTAAGNDVTKLSRLVDDCKKASCAVLNDATRHLAEVQTAAEKAAREQQLRNDLAAAGNDVTKLSKLVDDCKKASCAVLNEAGRRLTEAQTAADAAARELQFRNDLAAAGNDITKLRRIVDDCRKASCAVLTEASRRLTEAQTAADAAARELQFRNDLAAAGNDITKLRRIVDDCRKAFCTVLNEASRRLTEAQIAADAAAREQQFRSDLAAAGNDVAKLSRLVDDCLKLSCSVLLEAGSRLAKAREPGRPGQIGFTTNANYDMYGGDIEFRGDNGKPITFITTDSATCLTKCRDNSQCIAIVFDKWNRACHLKQQMSVLTQTPRSDTSIRADQKPYFETASPHTCPYPGGSLKGDPIRTFRAQSTDVCKRGCEGDKNCVAYMFRKSDGQCEFYNSVSDRTKVDPPFDSGERTQARQTCSAPGAQ